MIDQANLYLNLSSKLWGNQNLDYVYLNENTNPEILKDNKLYRQTTTKTGNLTGANVTWADSNQKKNYNKFRSEVGHEQTIATNKRRKSLSSKHLKPLSILLIDPLDVNLRYRFFSLRLQIKNYGNPAKLSK
jgi:hypothetical protein